MPWGPIVFSAIALCLVVLLVLAFVRMRRKKKAEQDSDSAEPEVTQDEIEAELGAAAGSPEDESDEPDSAEARAANAEQEAKKAAARQGLKPGHDTRQPSEISETLPDSPMAFEKKPRRQPKKSAQDTAAESARLAVGLAKTRGGFIARLGALFKGKSELDPALVEKIEEILFTADIGVNTSHELIEDLRRALSKHELQKPEAVWDHIKQRSAAILDAAVAPPLELDRAKPLVVLVVGVNGTGKTTTIGKLAARIHEEGRSVLLAAGDTFRAAAAEQLQIWGDRASAEVVKGKEGADPSSVIIEALKKAQETRADIVIADTAGRLHTKVDLMEEIQKVRRSIAKRLEGAPHETFLVLDATTGQNAIAQAKMFKEAVDITGIILTKLDGTAKGGVVLGICNELKVPVRFIGIGERAEDLRDFDPKAFVDALYQEAGAEV